MTADIEPDFIHPESAKQLSRFSPAFHCSDADLSALTAHDLLNGVLQALGGYDERWHKLDPAAPATGVELTLEDAYEALHLLPTAKVWLDDAERVLIEVLRDQGATWDDLGESEGRGANAMQQYYRRLGGKRTWPTRRPSQRRNFGGPISTIVQPEGRPWGVTETGNVRHWLERDRWWPLVSNNPCEGHRAFALCSRGVEPLDLIASAKVGRDITTLADLPRCAACHRVDNPSRQ